MLSDYKIIHSYHKADLRFIAAGSYQIEFFKLDNTEYFAIHRFMPEDSRYMLIDMSESNVKLIGEFNYQIDYQSSVYGINFTVKNGSLEVFVIRKLWGWLPLSRLGGVISDSGASQLKCMLKQYLSIRAT